MQAQHTERKWALTRLAKGDYLLPSNDRTRLFRIVHSEEEVWDEHDTVVPTRYYWQVWIYERRLPIPDWVAQHLADSIETFDGWELIESWFKTRREAIDLAVEYGEARRADGRIEVSSEENRP